MNCKLAKHDALGFTLIELLVVMAILSLLLMVVGPLSSQQIERSEAQAEWLQVQNIVKKLPDIAYARGENVSLILDGGMLAIEYLDNSRPIQYEFEHIFFQPQTLTLNSHGFATPEKLSLVVRKQEREITIRPLSDIQSRRAVDSE